jgi:hypothetical protein
MYGQRIGYIRVSTLDQHTERQLEGIEVDKTFLDKAQTWPRHTLRQWFIKKVGFFWEKHPLRTSE